MGNLIGKPMRRVDGRAKVTGTAKYAAEFQLKNLAYSFIVTGTIAKGRIKEIDTKEAEKAAGVLAIFTHLNAPKLAFQDKKDKDGIAPEGTPFRALTSDRVLFSGQPLALVVADTFENARYAASLVKINYEKETSTTNFAENLANAFEPNEDRSPKPRGNVEAALKTAEVKIEAEYTIPIEHHNPMEPHGAIAFWEQNKLTIFDKTQWVFNVRGHLASVFGIPDADVRVISPYVGGAFGASLRPNYYPLLAAMASRELKRPVKVVYTRRQMFTGHGYRPHTWQKVALGATKDGKLTAISHEAIANTSSYENYTENPVSVSREMYACPNVQTKYKIVKLDLPTPLFMRAPGAVSGMFALECALDELAYELKMDPLELRLKNYAETHPDNGKPFSSKALRECYQQAAEKFGWKKRNPEPRSMSEGKYLIGWGMATGTWGSFQAPATIKLTLNADGTAVVQTAASDMGPGTYTTISMITANFLGLPVEKVSFQLGDSEMPFAPVHGGSLTTASVGSAARGVCQQVLKKLLGMSSLKDANWEDVSVENGKIMLKSDSGKSESLVDILRRNNLPKLEETFTAVPNPERGKYAIASHSAQFVEVKIDEDFGRIIVSRVVEASAAGKIMNPKTAHSQEMGGVVWGIGMALHEETVIDHRYGRFVNPNLAGYHVPVNADIHDIDTFFVEEEDKIVNELGVKGLGELGMVGIPAAIANAVFHATGKRIRELPITVDKLI